MITRAQQRQAQEQAARLMEAAGIRLSSGEREAIAVADFGLGRLETEGAQILTFVDTDRIAAKVIALLPGQTLPEHWHRPVGSDPGKEETLRVIAGPLYLYTPGPDTLREGRIPPGKEQVYSVRHERVMRLGDQVTLAPGDVHWFQAGPTGAVLYSFSTTARDILDGFTDPDIVRQTVIADEPRGETP